MIMVDIVGLVASRPFLPSFCWMQQAPKQHVCNSRAQQRNITNEKKKPRKQIFGVRLYNFAAQMISNEL